MVRGGNRLKEECSVFPFHCRNRLTGRCYKIFHGTLVVVEHKLCFSRPGQVSDFGLFQPRVVRLLLRYVMSYSIPMNLT
jgi:hypothetical protein